jgi:hypothetical protein
MLELWQRRRCGRRISKEEFQLEALEAAHELSRREQRMLDRAINAVDIPEGETLPEDDAYALMDTALLSYLKNARSRLLERAILKKFEPFGEA